MNNGMRLSGEQLRAMPVHVQEQVALHYLAQWGMASTVPAVPGCDNLHFIAEMSFRNGEAHRTEQILEILLDRRTRVRGEAHQELVELIRIVGALC